jgi:phosphoribosyl 1,2-cyclic phosphodiesterase
MKIKIWGARGTTSTPERRNARYGGNTPCIEVRLDNGTLIVLDCGTGLRPLGNSLQREFGERPIVGFIFLTHFHWDHIQGIPFFPPLYKAGNIFWFHCAGRAGPDTQAAIEGQMAHPYFPVKMDAMPAVHHFFDLGCGRINVNKAVITSRRLNHPQGCVGYRIEADGSTFVLATDTEPGSRDHDRSVRDLAQGADILIYDAQYTPEQLQHERKGWGHSSWLEGTRIAQECGVKHLLLYHHDPASNDDYIDQSVDLARQKFSAVGGAAEGMRIDLCAGAIRWANDGLAEDRRRARRMRVELPVHIRWRDLGGRQVETQGLTRDVSEGGIYFTAPAEVNTQQAMDLGLKLPEEIMPATGLEVRYLATPIRKEKLNGILRSAGTEVGVAARFLNFPPGPQPFRSTANR